MNTDQYPIDTLGTSVSPNKQEFDTLLFESLLPDRDVKNYIDKNDFEV